MANTISNTVGGNAGDPNKAAQLLSHAVLGAVVAYNNGGSAAAGAVSGAGSEAAGDYLLKTLYPGKEKQDLNEQEKQQLKGLTNSVAAVAGGLTGNSAANVAIAAVVADNAVDNNFLSPLMITEYEELSKKLRKGGALVEDAIRYKELAYSDQKSDQLLIKSHKKSITKEEDRQLKEYANIAAEGDPEKAKLILERVAGDSIKSNTYNLSFAIPKDKQEQIAFGVANGLYPTKFFGLIREIPKSDNEDAFNKAQNIIDYDNSWHQQVAKGVQPGLVFVGSGVGSGVALTYAAGGSFQVGTGIGQVSDGKTFDGALNIVSGAVNLAPSVTVPFMEKVKLPGSSSASELIPSNRAPISLVLDTKVNNLKVPESFLVKPKLQTKQEIDSIKNFAGKNKKPNGVLEKQNEINTGQQNKHIEGTNEHKTANATSTTPKSRLTADPEELMKKSGTGQQVNKFPVGQPGSRERIDFGEKIGEYYNKETKKFESTTRGIVHYGKDGAHIIPSEPLK